MSQYWNSIIHKVHNLVRFSSFLMSFFSVPGTPVAFYSTSLLKLFLAEIRMWRGEWNLQTQLRVIINWPQKSGNNPGWFNVITRSISMERGRGESVSEVGKCVSGREGPKNAGSLYKLKKARERLPPKPPKGTPSLWNFHFAHRRGLVFSTSLLSGSTRCPRLILHISCSISGITFVQGAQVPSIRHLHVTGQEAHRDPIRWLS